MGIRVDEIDSEEELKRAQAAAQANGTSIPNYQDWANILENLKIAGVDSTGSYNGDKALLEEIERQIDELIEEAQQAQQAEELQKTNGIQESTETDREQEIKANLANATSSMILADYMKYYHLMG